MLLGASDNHFRMQMLQNLKQKNRKKKPETKKNHCKSENRNTYSQSTSRVTWNCKIEMNVRNPLCKFQHSIGMLKFSRKIYLKLAN